MPGANSLITRGRVEIGRCPITSASTRSPLRPRSWLLPRGGHWFDDALLVNHPQKVLWLVGASRRRRFEMRPQISPSQLGRLVDNTRP